ncbi:hypothetical protein Lsan_1009 [Legionella santicrucis]|uniref:Uncharacterized protein n=1 Tax=Legionella santicrucis TaxID=45074 RepID=A0A0W0Z365_9GAMM|nr:hypothetical protein [Legionella santicrucis]KTD63576.1 hypothetical protein Lsan_1009 [Legionella santicrucis]
MWETILICLGLFGFGYLLADKVADNVVKKMEEKIDELNEKIDELIDSQYSNREWNKFVDKRF